MSAFRTLTERASLIFSNAAARAEHALVWSNISKFMRMRISQFAASIPLIGYLILWSDKFKEAFVLQKMLGAGLWFDTSTRLQLIYYGAISLAVVWLVFQRFCPAVIKRHPSVQDYLFEQATINDAISFRGVLQYVEPFFKRDAGDTAWTPLAPSLVRRALLPRYLRDAVNHSTDPKHQSTIRYAFYLAQETQHPWALLICALLTAIGVVLVSLPSLEVFVLVARHSLAGRWHP